MEILLGIALSVTVLFSAAVLPWINRNRIQSLKQEIDRLNQIITVLVSAKESQKPVVPADQPADPAVSRILADNDQDSNVTRDETTNADRNARFAPDVSSVETR